MSMELSAPLRPINNDRMAAFTAFRAPQPAQILNAEGSAAPALAPTAAPRPTHIDEGQAESIIESVQHSGQEDMLAAHSGLDAERVARLLNLI